jgi:hypothetical protein
MINEMKMNEMDQVVGAAIPTGADGSPTSFPDVCKTPTASGAPVPFTFPNMAQGNSGSNKKDKISGSRALGSGSECSTSGGVISNNINGSTSITIIK